MALSYHGDEQEKRFLNVLWDLTDYGDRLVLIGGWLPFIYARYLWRLEESVYTVKTTDIDLAVIEQYAKRTPTVAERLAGLDGYVNEPVYPGEKSPYEIWAVYGEGGENRMRLDFLIREYGTPAKAQKKILGSGVKCLPLETVDFMLDKRRWTTLSIPTDGGNISVNILKPAAYLFIKGVSFAMRSLAHTDYKYRKDMWSMYFVLEYVHADQKEKLFKEIKALGETEYFNSFKGNLVQYFSAGERRGTNDLADFLKSVYPIQAIGKRIQSKFDELIEIL